MSIKNIPQSLLDAVNKVLTEEHPPINDSTKQHNISMSQSTGADKSKWVNFSLNDASGKQIGSLMLSSHDDGANYSVREANVDPAHRGLGHGKAMYLAAINFAKENNANLTSDKGISVDADNVWHSLRKMGANVSRHPNVKFVADKLRTHRNIDAGENSVSIPSDEPVWKYTNKQSAITESEEDYRGEHTAPGPDYGAPAHDLTRDIYPSDFYSSRGARLYGDGRDDDYKVHSQLRTLHNRPEAEVNIYRAVPNDSTIKEINPGDWVTTNLQYAHDHGERFDSHKILSKRVKAKEIFTDGNSFHEFGYHPQD